MKKSLTLIMLIGSLLALSSCTSSTNNNSPIRTPELITPQTLNTDANIVRTVLTEAYSEELLAEDVYTKMVEKYPQFTEVMNIINSEEKHSEKVGKLLDSRNIPRPTDYGVYNETYDVLIKMVDSSLTGAIEAGVMIEVGDIDHLLAEYKKIENQDIRRVFENIGGGSFNHLRAFLRLAKENNYTVTTDYARHMNSDEINSTGSLQSKMTNLLKANNLPTYGGGSMGMGNGKGTRNTENGTGGNQLMQ